MQRAYDMLIHDIALQNLNVALCMDRAGLSGDDGPTHHGLFDIGYLRHIPNMVHMQPKDEEEFVDMLWTMVNYHQGPIAIRYPRGAGTGAKPKPQPKLLEIGKAEVVQHGREVALIGLGNMFALAQETAELLEAEGVSVALINPRWIKPMDVGTLEFFARSVDVICTFEDHVLHNGFGCAVMEHLSDARITTPVVRIGWPDQFIEHGTIPVLRKKHGITAEAAVEKIKPFLKIDPKTNPKTAAVSESAARASALPRVQRSVLALPPVDASLLGACQTLALPSSEQTATCVRTIAYVASSHASNRLFRPWELQSSPTPCRRLIELTESRTGLMGALKGLFTRQYDEIHAAKNVSFQIEEGEFVGFLGPNGAGKTTVLKMLAGLLVPTSGTARVLGYIPWERKVAFQAPVQPGTRSEEFTLVGFAGS